MSDNPMGSALTESEASDQLEALLSDEAIEEEEEAEELDSEEPEGEEEDEAEDQEDSEETEEAEEADEETSIDSIADLAEALELSVEELQDKLTDTITVDGEQSEVTLKELRDGYQRDADYRQKTMSLAEDRKGFEAEKANYSKGIEAQHLYLSNVMQQLQQAYIGQPPSVELRSHDPSEYAAQVADYQQRAQWFQGVQQQAAQSLSAHQQTLTQQHSQQQQEVLQRESAKLKQAVPDWSNEKKAALESYLSDNFGITNDEMSSISDHRFIVLANKAMLFDSQAKATEQVAKKIKTKPKLQKPTKQRSDKQIRAKNLSGMKSRFRKTPSAENAAQLIEQLM